MTDPNSRISAFVAPTLVGDAGSSTEMGQMFTQQRDMLKHAQHEENTNTLLQDVLTLLHNNLVISEKIDLNGVVRHEENVEKFRRMTDSIKQTRDFLNLEINRLGKNVDRLQSSFNQLQQNLEQRMATREEVASLRAEMNASFASVIQKMDAAEDQRRDDMATLRAQLQTFLDHNSL